MQNKIKKYYLSVATIFKNESWAMKEWLEHYYFHGVDHVYLVNDFSSDRYLPILQPYIDMGFVTLFHNDISGKYDEVDDYGKTIDDKLNRGQDKKKLIKELHGFRGRQVEINNKFFKPILNETKWIAQVDCDEFLYSPKHIDLKKIIEQYESYGGIIANWVCFNSNGHVKQPPSIVKHFTKRCEYDASVIVNTPSRGDERVTFDATKMILNTDYKINSFDIHEADIEGKTINLSYYGLDDPLLLINHYQLQSQEYWEKIKMKRGELNYWNPIRDMNEHRSMDIGNIEDYRLSKQNDNMNQNFSRWFTTTDYIFK
tara:strand:- start:54 stop:995 length:942 start_codon:yes stop_codon:yes gene_type:complete